MTTYTTLNDLIAREITPALDGVEPGFDVDGFVWELRQRDLIVYSDEAQGFELVTDETGQTDGFWDLVAAFDAAAAGQR